MNVVWTAQARIRLAEIHDFIAVDSPDHARRTVDDLVERAESLARFPRRGRRLPELPRSELRELIAPPYRIVYRMRHGRIEVLTVFEAHRLLPDEDLSS